ncbi:MAG: hypothetical protein CMK29_05580 [Porticoccaceae bacterium]|nr:hypothetical protein [Porticoccaceae bacterium]MAH73551.1 hypothetical protein [Porticoccaceae bacterium]OUW58346.1 MAG: hypothetical protein CBD57_02200 [Candidatus Pelagibacter sp. TMED197]OUW59113.1 MAG: hypothetical protein CBD57_00985 [Candidatus Pelagibacter sp. TMED197]|tara:strand:+ start:16928 stop:17383 length:456 start_codon:yes stop_codon:yes gene_type:complete
MTQKLTKNNTFNLVYKREYQDSEDYDFFPIYYTIFRNVPIKHLKTLNTKSNFKKVKTFCDKNFIETATNATNHSEVEILTGDEYYRTYEDEFGGDITEYDKSFFNDYGQLWNTRQFFKYDFAPDLTKSLDARTYKNELKREGGNTYGKSRN